MAQPLSKEEFEDRRSATAECIQQLADWLWHESTERIVNRSHGDMKAMVRWRDGMPQFTRVAGTHTLKPRSPAKLPSKKLDG